MNMPSKIKKIISAIKFGVPLCQIDPVGAGNSARLLLQSKKPTQRKINQMYDNVLIIEKQTGQTFDSKDCDEDVILYEKLKLEKIEAIIEAVQTGMPKKYIDLIGRGCSLKRLLNGGNVTPEKVDQMYENILKFQQKDLAIKKELTRLVPTDPEKPDRSEKIQLILKAVKLGVKKSKIDIAASGNAINRLQRNENVKDTTVNAMYFNLLDFIGYTYKTKDFTSTPSTNANQRPSLKQTSFNKLQNLTQKRISNIPQTFDTNIQQQQINSLQNIITTLLDRINILEASVAVLQKEAQPSKKNYSKKILGATLMQKPDIVNGKKYWHWYGLYTDAHKKRRWIYIGNNVSNAKDKILAWFKRHPQDVQTTSVSL